MKVEQVYTFTNAAVKEVLGETAVVQEDLSNIVDIGTEIFNANALDKYVKALVDKIGKVVFVDRTYVSNAPKVLMDGWEYGNVCQKIDGTLPEAVINDSWELEDGQTYNQDIFYAPKISEKFFSQRIAFEIDDSIADEQAKSAFKSAREMGRFVSMIFTKINNAMTLRLDKLIMSTITNAMASTYYSDIGTSTASEVSGKKAINLLKLYNDYTGNALTVEKCLRDLDFLKFASEKIIETSDYLTTYSTLYNVGKKQRFTPKDLQHIVLLSEFKRCSEIYLQSPTYHDMLVKLPESETVNYWQGSGEDFSFDSNSKINVKTPEGNEVEMTGVLGCIFDHDALGVCCQDARVRTHINDKAEFVSYYYKFFAGYFNDMNENMVVFYVA